MLTRLIAVFVLILGLVLGGAGIANAEQDYPGQNMQKRYPSWKDQCYGIVTYKTNARHRFVKQEFNSVDNSLKNWTFVKVSKNKKADIRIKFKTPEKIAKKSDGNWIGFVYYQYRGSGQNKSFANARALVPNRGFAWKTVTTHEIWHAVGVAHVPEKYRLSIMNPIIYDSTNVDAYPNARDWRLLRSVDNKC